MQRQYKFTNKQIKTLQDFVKQIDKNIKIKKSYSFECDIENKLVFIGSKEYTQDTKLFMDWLCKQKEYTPINHILISILHEIGHIKTYTKAKEQERDTLYSIYSFLNDNNIMSTEQLNEHYFAIPDERDATMWGIKYYVNHKNECDKLVKDLQIM